MADTKMTMEATLSRARIGQGLVIVLTVIALAFVVRHFMPGKLVVDDLSRPHLYKIFLPDEDGYVNSLRLAARGRFEDVVKIELMTDQNHVVREYTVSESDHFDVRDDWYAPEAYLRITPVTASSGVLAVRYRFIDVL